MQWKRRESNAPRITINLDLLNRPPGKRGSLSSRSSVLGSPSREDRRGSFPFGIRSKVSRQRVVQILVLGLLAVCWNWLNGAPLISIPRWNGGANRPCVKGLQPPKVSGSGVGAPTLYTFPDSAKPFDGHYIATRKRSKREGELEDLRLANILHGVQADQPPPPRCLDEHIATGADCPGLGELNGKLDLVWVYANASDPLHHFYHSNSPTRPPHPTPHNPRAVIASTPREFDELRFSLRSVLTNFRESAGRLTVVLPEYPFPGCGRASQQWVLGQFPQWLRKVKVGEEGREMEWWDGDVSLRVLHRSELVGRMGDVPEGASFNSLGMEARLAYLEDVSNVFVYMNDDVFFASQLTTEDFYSPQFGPIFRIQPDLLVNNNRAKGGEWGPLFHTNELLDARFGHRPRPYLIHTSKTLLSSHLREITSIWADHLTRTSTHAHRTPSDISTTFLHTHYVVERWREALLWSFVVGSVGGDDDQWGEEQAASAWVRLGGEVGRREVSVRRGRRETLVGRGKGVDRGGGRKTKIVFSSYDGYPYTSMGRAGFKEYPDFTSGTPNHPAGRCVIRFAECFTLPWSSNNHKASEVFKHVAFRNPACGDCMISALVTRSGENGLSAFLPDASRRFPTRKAPRQGRRAAAVAADRSNIKLSSTSSKSYDDEVVARLPVAKSWETADFTLRGVQHSVGSSSVREWVLQAIYRYRFAVGSTAAEFIRLETPIQSNRTLLKLDKHRAKDDAPGLICVNDDVRWEPETIRELLQGWMGRRWSRRAAWEV